jgi:hypothetical protein
MFRSVVFVFLSFVNHSISQESVIKKDVLHIAAIAFEDNRFEVQLSSHGQSVIQNFIDSISLQVFIEESYPTVLTEDGNDITTISFQSTGSRRFCFDELTLPTRQSSKIEMLISGNSNGDKYDILPFRANVQVGCTDKQYTNLLECILNCANWRVIW